MVACPLALESEERSFILAGVQFLYTTLALLLFLSLDDQQEGEKKIVFPIQPSKREARTAELRC